MEQIESFVFIFVFRNTIIQLALAEDKNKVRIEHLNFLGNLQRSTVNVADIESVAPFDGKVTKDTSKIKIALDKRGGDFLMDVSKAQLSGELMSKFMARVNDGKEIDIEFPEQKDDDASRPYKSQY